MSRVMLPPMPALPTLVLFCRRPAPGVGKRRLAADIGDDDAAVIGELLLHAALEDARDWPGPVVIAPAEAEDCAWAGGLLPGVAEVHPQPGGNLGERINAIDRSLRDEGHVAIVFIGSDAPSLTPDDYALTRSALGEDDVVLGAAEDGGVTLMASRHPWPELGDLPWESAALGDALRALALHRCLSLKELPMRFDVDRIADLHRLVPTLVADRRPARQALLGYVRNLLAGRHAAS